MLRRPMPVKRGAMAAESGTKSAVAVRLADVATAGLIESAHHSWKRK